MLGRVVEPSSPRVQLLLNTGSPGSLKPGRGNRVRILTTDMTRGIAHGPEDRRLLGGRAPVRALGRSPSVRGRFDPRAHASTSRRSDHLRSRKGAPTFRSPRFSSRSSIGRWPQKRWRGTRTPLRCSPRSRPPTVRPASRPRAPGRRRPQGAALPGTDGPGADRSVLRAAVTLATGC